MRHDFRLIPNILIRKPNPENSHKEIKINSKRKCNFHKLLEPNLATTVNPAESCLTCLRDSGSRKAAAAAAAQLGFVLFG